MGEQSSYPSSDADRNELANLIAQRFGGEDDRLVILGLMAGYDITKRETGLVVYDGGETDYLIKRFIVAKKVKGCTVRTCQLYDRNLRLGFERIGKSPTQCQHTDIQMYLASLIMRNLSKAYQQNVMRTFSSFFGWLSREELVQKNIMNKIDAIKANPPHKKAFSDMDVEKIRAGCRTKRETALVEILLSTGCRVFEVCNMRRDEVNGESIDIIGKGEKPRTVYLNARAQLAVAAYLDERKDSNPWLFPASICYGHSITEGGSRPMIVKFRENWYKIPENVSPDGQVANSAIESFLRGLGKRVGVENVHPHRFRRTCATLALRRGMPLTLVQQMLGHSSLATTQRYLDIQESELYDAHKKFVT